VNYDFQYWPGGRGLQSGFYPAPHFFYFCGVAVAVSKELVARGIAGKLRELARYTGSAGIRLGTVL
jgi:hypothetical protein